VANTTLGELADALAKLIVEKFAVLKPSNPISLHYECFIATLEKENAELLDRLDMDAIELLDSYEKFAKEAILDVTDGTIGAGSDPISFVICAFRAQADRIKELVARSEKAEPGIDTTGFKLALAYLSAPMVDPGYPSIKKPAFEALNKHLRDRGLEELKR